MKKTIKITESQLKKIVNNILNEQRSAGVNAGQPSTNAVPAGAGAAAPTTKVDNTASDIKSKAIKIKDNLIKASMGAGFGTYDTDFVNAIKEIKSKDLYNEVNSKLKEDGGYADIAAIINAEFNPTLKGVGGTPDEDLLKQMKKHFQTIGYDLTWSNENNSVRIAPVTNEKNISNSSSPNGENTVIDITTQNGKADLMSFIATSKLECLRNAIGKFKFVQNSKLGLKATFYLSSDIKQYLMIYSDAKTFGKINDDKGVLKNIKASARCNKGNIELYEGNKLMYMFNPKNPIKQVGGGQAKTEDDLKAGKGSVSRGMKGELVSKIQQMLKDLTYPVEVNGAFDNATYNAVIEYQKSAQLKPDGIVGTKTYSSLVEYHALVTSRRVNSRTSDFVAPRTIEPSSDVAGLQSLKGKINAPNLADIEQAKRESQYNEKGNVFFRENWGKNLNYQDGDTNKIIWKGPELTDDELNALNIPLKRNGWMLTKTKDKRYGKKHVWVKSKPTNNNPTIAPPIDNNGQPQPPFVPK